MCLETPEPGRKHDSPRTQAFSPKEASITHPHCVDVSGTGELLITSYAILWQQGGGRHICTLLYVFCQCSGDTESGLGKKSSISVR